VKSKLVRIAAVMAVISAVATAAAPIGAAATKAGSGGEPPIAVFCVDDFGGCAPTPAPFYAV
jgi:hypothetical protein